MTDGSTRALLVALSVVTASSLALGGSWWAIARTDAAAHARPPAPVLAPVLAPAPGLVAAPVPRRRVVVVRRSRAS